MILSSTLHVHQEEEESDEKAASNRDHPLVTHDARKLLVTRWG
jgi:hypothetical protein